MYFKSREAAGKLLAGQIAKKYQHEDCAVIALSDGGVLVGMHVAMKLRCVIMMLMSKEAWPGAGHRQGYYEARFLGE